MQKWPAHFRRIQTQTEKVDRRKNCETSLAKKGPIRQSHGFGFSTKVFFFTQEIVKGSGVISSGRDASDAEFKEIYNTTLLENVIIKIFDLYF